MRKTTVLIIVALMLTGLFVTRACAGKTLDVPVSCIIPSLFEMNIEPENIESALEEAKESDRKYIKREERKLNEDELNQLISESKTENKVIVYTFYER